MVDKEVFDVWSGSYDAEVRDADEKDEYPFAGYKRILDSIYTTVTKQNQANVLDIGIGTGTLAASLYNCGHIITGIDFSEEMLQAAKTKIPNATLYRYDFANGLPPELSGKKYDFIISTYALHHLTDELKVSFIKSLLPYLNEDGAILIGDIGFPTLAEYNECKEQNSDDWDDDEYYLVFSELTEALKGYCSVTYKQMSHCAGLLEIKL